MWLNTGIHVYYTTISEPHLPLICLASYPGSMEGPGIDFLRMRCRFRESSQVTDEGAYLMALNISKETLTKFLLYSGETERGLYPHTYSCSID